MVFLMQLDKHKGFYYDMYNSIHKSDDEEEVTVFHSEQKAAGMMRGARKNLANTSFSPVLKRNE